MAVVAATEIWLDRNDIIAYEWTLTDGDTATAVKVPNRSDKTVQASGDFDASGDIRVEGSLDPDAVVFTELNDPQGNGIALTSAGIDTVLENVAWIRPKLQAGTGVSIVVRIVMAGG